MKKLATLFFVVMAGPALAQTLPDPRFITTWSNGSRLPLIATMNGAPCSTNQFVRAFDATGLPVCATPTTGSSTVAAGSSGQFQTNSGGSLAGVTVSGDVTIDGTTGTSVVTSTGRTIATQNQPNATWTFNGAGTTLMGPDGLNQILFGGFGSQFVGIGKDPGTHSNAQGVHSIVGNVTGSGTFGPASNDYISLRSVSKKNYLTSMIEGELDTNWNIVRQGAKGDASIFENYAHKVKGSGGDTGSILTSESEVAWENTSGLITQSIHAVPDGFLESAGGLSGGLGYGAFHEARAGLTWSADHSDILPDNGAGFATTNNVGNTGWCWIKSASLGRVVGGFYYGVRGPSCLSGSQQRGDVVVGIVGTQTTMRTDSAGKWSIRNNADTGDMIAVTQDGAINLPQFTVATLPTCNTGAKGKFMAVSDATAPTYNGTLTGGGAVSVPAYCNGTNWTAH